MAKLVTLAAIGTSLTASAAQTSVAMSASPFTPGFNLLAQIYMKGATGAPVVRIQGSNDAGSTWTDLLTTSGIVADYFVAEVTAFALMRSNVTTVGTAGTFAAYLEAGGAP